MAIVVEAAVDSIASAEQAAAEGADRLEVCANLGVGGLTPSTALLKHCLTLGLPCLAMVRPRAGDFFYGPTEIAEIHSTAGDMCEAGAAGGTGPLHERRDVGEAGLWAEVLLLRAAEHADDAAHLGERLDR